MRLVFQGAPNAAQNGGVHGGSNTACLRILLAWMIDAEQSRKSRGNFGFCAMRKPVQHARCNHAASFQDFEVDIPGDFSQRQDDFRFQDFEFTLEVAAAIQYLFGEWFVVGRRAAAGRADVHILQAQPILAIFRNRLIRKARFVERGIQEIAGAIARKHSSRAICSMCRRRKSWRLQIPELVFPSTSIRDTPAAFRALLFHGISQVGGTDGMR